MVEVTAPDGTKSVWAAAVAPNIRQQMKELHSPTIFEDRTPPEVAAMNKLDKTNCTQRTLG
jgi:hypothetical protein